jgi:microcystin-dependent protein
MTTVISGTTNSVIAGDATVQGNLTVTGTLFGGVPSGAVFWFAASAAPTGYLEANGASLSTTTYAALFAVIGYTYGGSGANFSLPDLRGEFIRGWDDGRGVDSGRVFGSSQAEETEAHQHIMPISWNTGNGDVLTPSSYLYGTSGSITTARLNGSTSASAGTPAAPLVSTQIATTSGETRPRNVALLPCIKT